MPEKEAPKVEDFTWPWEYKLRKPVKVKGEDMGFLSFREPTTEDMILYGVLNGTFEGDLALKMFARLVEGTPEAMKRDLHPQDYFAIWKHFIRFFTAAQSGSEDT